MTATPTPTQGTFATVAAYADTVDRILAVLLARRRPFVDDDRADDGVDAAESIPNYARAQPQWIRILDFVLTGEPVHFTLPAFPCKSPNPDKVAGPLPDEGERLALVALESMCEEIRRVYPPGARVTICSDGHVFADVIGVPDRVVTEYSAALRAMIEREGCVSVDTFDLDDLWGDDDVETKRRRLVSGWMESMEDLRTEARGRGEVARMLRGMTRFLREDSVDLSGTSSAQQRIAKRRAYEVLARSRAWGTVVGSRIPRAVRLSIHPQPPGSPKFGIALIGTALIGASGVDSGWGTPWHSVVIYDRAGHPALARHDVARTLGRPEYRDSRVWCYRDRSEENGLT